MVELSLSAGRVKKKPWLSQYDFLVEQNDCCSDPSGQNVFYMNLFQRLITIPPPFGPAVGIIGSWDGKDRNDFKLFTYPPKICRRVKI